MADGQPNAFLSHGPILLQSNQTVQSSQPGIPVPTGAAAISATHPNLQLWAPNAGTTGAVGVSGLGMPRSNAGLVTLSSGQTVLMANLISTSANQTLSIPVNSLAKPIQTLPHAVSSAGGLLIPGAVSSFATSVNAQLAPLSGSMHGSSGPITVAMPSGMIPNSSVNQVSDNTIFPSGTQPGSLIMDSSNVPRFATASARPDGAACFTSGSTFQTIVASDPLQFDPNTVNVAGTTLPVCLATMTHNTNATAVLSQNMANSCVPNLKTEEVNKPQYATVSEVSNTFPLLTAVTTTANSSMLQSSVGMCMDPLVNASSSTTQVLTTGGNTSQTQLELMNTSQSSSASENNDVSLNRSVDLPSKTNDPPSPILLPLHKLINDTNPMMQIDPESGETLNGLATELVLTMCQKAQSLAKHRESPLVELKDVVFAFERGLDVFIPSQVFDDRHFKRTLQSEAHKQRMGLIRKQIKKM